MYPVKPGIVSLPANRVRRNYRGGRFLDAFEGRDSSVDSERPEDWIASTIEAINPGMTPNVGEGLAKIVGPGGKTCLLREMFASDPDYFLGRSHVDRLGLDLGFLAKLLDASMRLHVQAHPTAAFAQEHLNSRYGKFESYVMLQVRPNTNPYIRLGFQHPPSADEWRRIVFEQDISAMDSCFEPISVNEGEVWIVPGGYPHAIGGGILMLEVMEPSDLVVRCEFSREGIEVPPEGRFMGRDPDFALQIFNFSAIGLEEARRRFCVRPTLLDENRTYRRERLIGHRQTDCFTIDRFRFSEDARVDLTQRVQIGLVSKGAGNLTVGSTTVESSTGGHFLIPALETAMRVETTEAPLEILICAPG